MRTNTNKSLLVVAASLVACIIIVWFSTSIRGGEATYEIEPEITLPEYMTDTTRIINAYERMMDRYVSLTERNLGSIGTDVREVVKRLDSIDHELANLSARIARIEKALGVESPKPSIMKHSQTDPLQKMSQEDSSPATD